MDPRALIAGGPAVVGNDAIHANIGHLPPGQAAGYDTGTPGIRWTANDWITHPGAVRIDQDGGSDPAADVLDVERGAATPPDCPDWARRAIRDFEAAARPGQRQPAIYASASSITPVVNALIAGGVSSGVGLWVANWSLSSAQAFADVLDAAGPFPIVAVQWRSLQFYDEDVFSGAWLSDVSGQQHASFKHATVAGETLGSLAAARNMDVWAWLGLQRKLSEPQAEHLVKHAAPEPGSTWRSVSP